MVCSVLGQILSVGHPGLAVHQSPSVLIQTNPWAGLLPEQGLCSPEGSPGISSRRLFRGYDSRSLYLSRGYAPGGSVEQVSIRHDAPLVGRAPGQSVFKPTRGRGCMFHSR